MATTTVVSIALGVHSVHFFMHYSYGLSRTAWSRP